MNPDTICTCFLQCICTLYPVNQDDSSRTRARGEIIVRIIQEWDDRGNVVIYTALFTEVQLVQALLLPLFKCVFPFHSGYSDNKQLGTSYLSYSPLYPGIIRYQTLAIITGFILYASSGFERVAKTRCFFRWIPPPAIRFRIDSKKRIRFFADMHWGSGVDSIL